MREPVSLVIAEIEWERPPFAALAAAMAATRSRYWGEAIKLWRDQFRRGHYRKAAAFCLAEAGLQSGDFDLADHMRAQLGEPFSPIETLNERTEMQRAARIAWFGSEYESALGSAERAKREVELGLFGDAIETLVNSQQQGDATHGILMRALHGLGAHDSVCAVGAKIEFAAEDVAALIDDSNACRARRAEALPDHARIFLAEHPAGEFLHDVIGVPA